MIKLNLSSVSFTIICCFLFFNSQAQESWELYSNSDNIRVFTRYAEGSPYKEIKIEMELEGDINTFMETLNDAEKYTDWVYKCSSSERVKTISENEYVYYVATDMPYPIRDRDLVIHSTQRQDPETKIIYSSSKAVPDAIPNRSGVIRIDEYESNWKVAPNGPGKIKVDYWSKTNPGGSIPAWIVNLGITMGPTRSMEALKKQVNRRSE